MCGEASDKEIRNEAVPAAERLLSSEESEYYDRLARAICGDYELSDLIGQGGFGSVYAARDKRLDRDVAVKALRHDLFPTPAILMRFEREAKAVAKLRHPNILPVYTIGEGEGIAYMVMPLVEGESLQMLMEREGRLPVEEAVQITAETAAALEAAHRFGFVHRDVKPANIMLDGDERRVMLMDFGIAKVITAEDTGITGTGVIIGSPAYMSPEQARGQKDIDGRSDLYSLGAVAYELLTGRRPFEADSLHELVYKHVTDEVDDIGTLVPSIPGNVRHAVMRSLAKDRDRRWQTAADFRRQLLAAKTDSSTVDDSAGTAAESWFGRRGPYVLFLLFSLYIAEFLNGVWEAGFGGALPYWDLAGLWTALRVAVFVLLLAAVTDAVVRAGWRILRGDSPRQVARFMLGQPSWWQAWYPRTLRIPDSVWDRLPFAMKLLRSLFWVELIVDPSGWVLLVFVFPTFQAVMHGMGRSLPLPISAFAIVVQVATYALPVTLLALGWQFQRLRRTYSLSRAAFWGSLFNLRGGYWQGSPARVMLRD